MRHSDIKELHPQFLNRWSPRSFKNEPISNKELTSLFEAARWAPSCYNEQPWFYAYAQEETKRQAFLKVLVEGNQQWAKTAPVLAFCFARKHFKKNDQKNDWAHFDAGAATVSMAFQALHLGFYIHPMAGFSKEGALDVTGLSPEKYDAMCAIAIGKVGPPANLPESLQAKESPNSRQDLENMILEIK